MLKRITLLTVFFATLASTSSFAQSSSTATQTVHIQVAPAIEILTNTLTQILLNYYNNQGGGKGKGKGNKMSDNNTYGNDQQIIVRSNKDFIVSVKSENNTTDNDILLALAQNNTGGHAANAFSQNRFVPVSTTSQDLITNCAFGNERSFAVNYKTKNNSNEQRLTKADIIYTATLP
jgi:hypothetical protein